MAGHGTLARILVATLATLGISCQGASQESERALERLKEIHQTLMDRDQVFSIRETLAELEVLEPKLPADNPVVQGELNYLRGYVLARKGEAEEAFTRTGEALRIDALSPFLPEEERVYAIHRLATLAEEIGEWDVAIESDRKILSLSGSEFNEDQRLGIRAQLGFCLHEAKNYAEAMTVNQALLAEGEKRYGLDSTQLLVVITNLAQNAYELGEFEVAKSFLERRLSIATKHEAQSHIDDSFFQLGVLAFEQGHSKEAESLMKRRLELTEKSGDEDRIESAQEDLRILYEKMGR